MAESVVLHGTLVEGKGPCQDFKSDEGKLLSLIGAIVNVKIGDIVYVVGTPTDASACGKPTIMVSWIGTKLNVAGPTNTVVIRDVEVVATYSSYDTEPVLKLEGRDFTLKYDNARGSWYGSYPQLQITATLHVVFVSEGWIGQSFDVSVKVTDALGQAKEKSQTFSAVATKGTAVIDREMDV